ncbi:hypothetical protein QCD60_16880 [Pokkaliibacter sp. MBI-7]|uniref:hypothetical protein n=1 Tax=Pokkaliibacter sp. MBI-7 TaxID=3040600 RepID=UPI002449356E|nr:hypothetical protein [Pokkaliibacter sp. MBI-7]MDH2434234.1 hypothetical protein [Pokkaliibacter sp. MBI-7]
MSQISNQSTTETGQRPAGGTAESQQVNKPPTQQPASPAQQQQANKPLAQQPSSPAQQQQANKPPAQQPSNPAQQQQANKPPAQQPSNPAQQQQANKPPAQQPANKAQAPNTEPPIIFPSNHARPEQQDKKTWWKRPFLLLVVLPILLIATYLLVIESDRYVSYASVIVKQSDELSTATGELSLLGSALGKSGNSDLLLVQEYVLSRDMMKYLESELHLRNHYENSGADPLSKAWTFFNKEDMYQYYKNHVSADIDTVSGVLNVQVQAFTPEYSQEVVQAIIKRSEWFINQISQNLAREQVSFVEGELKRSQDLLRGSQKDVIDFQQKFGLFSPEQDGAAMQGNVNQLEAQLVQAEADLKAQLSYMSSSAPDAIKSKSKIAALNKQLALERAKLASSEKKNTLSDMNAQYQDLKISADFALDAYKSALISLEKARIDAYRKLKNLVVIDSPSLPESAELPNRMYNLLTAAVVILLLYGIGVIILATIREHRDM